MLIPVDFAVSKEISRKRVPRNAHIFDLVYSKQAVEVSPLGERSFLNVLPLYPASLVRSLSWNRLKSPGREVRTQACALLHALACAYVHAQSEEIWKSYHGGSARKLRLFVSPPPPPSDCFRPFALPSFSPSTNLFLPAFSSFQHPLYMILLLSYSPALSTCFIWFSVLSRAKSTKAIKKKIYKIETKNSLDVLESIYEKINTFQLKNILNIQQKRKAICFYLQCALRAIFASIFLNVQIVESSDFHRSISHFDFYSRSNYTFLILPFNYSDSSCLIPYVSP